MISIENQFDGIAEQYSNMEADEAGNHYEFAVNWPSLVKFLPIAPATVMDYGCGAGVFSEKLLERGFDVLAVDNSETMVKLAQRRGLAAMQWGYRDSHIPQTFDAVVAKLVVQFVEDLGLFGQVIRQQLKPRGRLIISVPLTDKSRKLAPASSGECVEKVGTTGLSVTMIHRDLQTYKNTLQDAGFKLKSTDEPIDPDSVSILPKRLNMCFEAIA